MSCYVHSNEEFNEVYTYLLNNLKMSDEDAKFFTEAMNDLECTSFITRYNEKVDSEINLTKSSKLLTNIEMLKRLDSVKYQSSTSRELMILAEKIINPIINEIIVKNKMVFNYQENYGYEEATTW